MIKQVATDKQYGFQWAITKDDNNLSLQDIIKNDKNQSTFKIVLKIYSENWDMMWVDSGVNVRFFQIMHSHQVVNHFPGMQMITNK